MTTNMNIIDITNDVTEIKEEGTMTENTNMTTIEKETTVDEARNNSLRWRMENSLSAPVKPSPSKP